MGRLFRLLGVLPALCYAPCLPMTNNAGVYTVVTRIGTPGQPLNLVADTGSYNLLLASTLCTQRECSMHNVFNPAQSPTYVSGNFTTVTGYGQGQVMSRMASDIVTLT